MTRQQQETLIEVATHWEKLADTEEVMAAWERDHGIDLSEPGESSGDHRAEVARRCARTLRKESETGMPHCMCHELPITVCRSL